MCVTPLIGHVHGVMSLTFGHPRTPTVKSLIGHVLGDVINC